jgi:DNA polymerase-3 subunit delta
LNAFAAGLKAFSWKGVRLLISAGKIDKRKSFYKTIEKLALVESLNGWTAEDKDWAEQAEACARRALTGLGKTIDNDSMGELVERAGAERRGLMSEIEKLALYTGERARIGRDDVETVVTPSKQARAFALADALGERDLPRALRCLDEEIWSMRLDRQKSEIGLLYGLISKVRVMILLSEMLKAGWIKQGGDYNRFKPQLERIPPDALPEDKRYNPLAFNAYVLFKALPQVRRYSTEELVRAMQLLLECNRDLISSKLDGDLILQRALVQIISRPPGGGDSSRGRAGD